MTSGNQTKPQPRSIKLTPRDIDILEELANGRYETVSQLAVQHWRRPDGSQPTSLRPAQRRLQYLREAGLLRVIKQRVQKGEGDLPYIYALDRPGAMTVSKERERSYEQIDWKPKALEENYIFLQHLLETHNLRIAIILSCEKHGMQLTSWLYESVLRGKEWAAHVMLKDTDEKSERVVLIPDGFCELKTARGRGYFPIEIDRGNVSLSRWKRKIQAYIEYHASGEFQKRYARNFRLLTLTSSMNRLLNLKKECEAVASQDDRFWFATFDQVRTKIPTSYTRPGTTKTKTSYTVVYNADLLTAPVWYKSGSDTLHSLME